MVVEYWNSNNTNQYK